MLPDAHDAPAGLPQKPEHLPVALDIPRNLFTPEGGIVLRFGGMLGASMPETAIHENRNAVGAKDKIGFAIQRVIPPPAGDFVSAEDLDQAQFGIAVSLSADAGHDFAALGLGEDVGHLFT